MDIKTLRERKVELDKQYSDLNSAKQEIVKQMKNFSTKVAEINVEQVKLQGQSFDLNRLIEEIEPEAKVEASSVKK